MAKLQEGILKGKAGFLIWEGAWLSGVKFAPLVRRWAAET